MTGVLIRRSHEDRHTDRRVVYEDENRDWSDASTSQGLPATHRKLEVARKDSSLKPSKGAWPC